MTRYARLFAIVPAALAVLALGSAAPMGEGKEIELDEADVFIEWNSTDQDFGIHFFWDGDPWKVMKVLEPEGRTILSVTINKNLKEQGLTEGFFESAEPSIKDLSMEEFFERFPEGEYEFEGKTLEGDDLEGEKDFTHTLPAPPANLFPGDGDVVNPANPLLVSFDAVTQDLEGEELEPDSYEVIVESDGEERIFSMTLPGDDLTPSVTVPAEFFEPGTEYKLEVIAEEESGNKTISETEFTTAP